MAIIIYQGLVWLNKNNWNAYSWLKLIFFNYRLPTIWNHLKWFSILCVHCIIKWCIERYMSKMGGGMKMNQYYLIFMCEFKQFRIMWNSAENPLSRRSIAVHKHFSTYFIRIFLEPFEYHLCARIVSSYTF